MIRARASAALSLPPYDPNAFRPTGGGWNAIGAVSTARYSHFSKLDLGRRGRLHEINYEGDNHGKDSAVAICEPQLGFAAQPMAIDGYTGGVIAATRSRITIDSVYDWIDGTNGFQVTDSTGQTELVKTDRSTKYFVGTIVSVVPNFDTPGSVSIGLDVTLGDVVYRNSDDNGQTWKATKYFLDSFTLGTARAYRPSLMVNRNGTVVVFLYKTDIATNLSYYVRFVSRDDGDTWSGELPVAFTGLEDGETVILHSKWRQRGDGSFCSAAQAGNRSYFEQCDDDGATIACNFVCEVVHAVDNDLTWPIESINTGTKTVTLAASAGDVTGYWINLINSTIAGTGAANGTSYCISSSYGAGKTSIVLNSLSAGTIGASSRIKRTYGPRQIIGVDIPNRTVRIPEKQASQFVDNRIVGINGTSGGGDSHADGLSFATNSATEGGSNPGYTDLVLSGDIPAGTVPTSSSRLTNVTLGEYGIGLLTDRNITLVPRAIGMPSAVPRLRSEDGGETWVLCGTTNTTEGSYVAFQVDFVDTGRAVMEVISWFARGGVNKFMAIACEAGLARTSCAYFSPPVYFNEIVSSYPNSGYHNMVWSGPRCIMTYGKETGLAAAEVHTFVPDLSALFNGTTYATRAPAATDDITKGRAPGDRWAVYDGSALYEAISTAEGAAVWTLVDVLGSGGNSWAYRLNADQALTINVTAPVLWDTAFGKSNGGVRGNLTYDATTGLITTPTGGYLSVHGMVRVLPAATGSVVTEVDVDLDPNASTSLDALLRFFPPTGNVNADVRFDVSRWYLEAGGTVRITAKVSGTTGTPSIDSTRSYFTGYLDP